MSAILVRRRLAVAYAALPVVRMGRQLELAGLPALARVAVLSEAAGALAAMARRQARLSHVDARQVAVLVTDPADAFAVLGRGRWLPTMERAVLAKPAKPAQRRAVQLRVGQASLFSYGASAFNTTSRGGE